MMKKFVCCILSVLSAANSGMAQIVSFADLAFKQALLDHVPEIDLDGDNEIQYTEAAAYNGIINVGASQSQPGSISDLSGIEAFEQLAGLIADHNQIEQIDLSANPLVTELYSVGNPLASLELSQNSQLSALLVIGHQMEAVNLEPNTALTDVTIIDGELSSLSIGEKPGLMSLSLQRNQLGSLDISGAAALLFLDLGENAITNVDLSANSALQRVLLDHNELQHLDLSQHPDLQAVNVASNLYMRSLNLKNGANSEMDLSGASNASNFADMPALEVVCLDDEDSPLAHFIQGQTDQEVLLTQDCALGIPEVGATLVSVSPNPVVDLLYIRSGTPLKQIEVFDITGKRLIRQNCSNPLEIVDLGSLKTGLYLFRFLLQGGDVMVKRIVKLG